MSSFKKYLFKALIYFALILNLGLLIPAAAFASPFNQTLCTNGASDARNLSSSPYCSDDPSTDPVIGGRGIIDKVTNIIALVGGIAAVIMLIISGLLFVTAGGDAKGVETARNTIIYTLIGLVVIVLARFIIEFVVSKVS